MSDSRHSGVYFKMSGFCMCLNATLKVFSEPAEACMPASLVAALVCVCVSVCRYVCYINMLLTSVPFHSFSDWELRAVKLDAGNEHFYLPGTHPWTDAMNLPYLHVSAIILSLMFLKTPGKGFLQYQISGIVLWNICILFELHSNACCLRGLKKIRLHNTLNCERTSRAEDPYHPMRNKDVSLYFLTNACTSTTLAHVKGSGKRPLEKKGTLSILLPSFPPSPSSHLWSVTLLSDLKAWLSGVEGTLGINWKENEGEESRWMSAWFREK